MKTIIAHELNFQIWSLLDTLYISLLLFRMDFYSIENNNFLAITHIQSWWLIVQKNTQFYQIFLTIEFNIIKIQKKYIFILYHRFDKQILSKKLVECKHECHWVFFFLQVNTSINSLFIFFSAFDITHHFTLLQFGLYYKKKEREKKIDELSMSHLLSAIRNDSLNVSYSNTSFHLS